MITKVNKKASLLLLMVATLSLFLVACTTTDTSSEYDNETKRLIFEYSNNESEDTVYVTPQELIVEKEGEETKRALPEDEFYVSIAPYYDSTHECTTHYLTKCVGELKNELFLVEVINEKGDTVLLTEATSTAKGWIDLWLPRDQTYSVTLTHGDVVKTKTISTFDDSKTCVSDFLLN